MRIFYSWQSDLPNRTNRTFIELALQSAADKLHEDVTTQVQAVVDRDTAGLTGSPHMAKAIFEKIYSADAFVGDLSIVGAVPPRSADGKPRPTPNPNVLTELGYAVGALGWERVILVCNEAYAPVKDLPFDLDRNRVMAYSDADTDHPRGESRELLAERLSSALRQVHVADQEARLPPTLRSLRTSQIRDETERRVATPPKNLKRANEILGWQLSEEELSQSVADAAEAADRMRRVPLPAASLLSVLLGRAAVRRTSMGSRAERLHFADARLATGLDLDTFRELVGVLEHHDVIWVEPDDEDGTLWINWRDLTVSGWPFVSDLRVFSERTGTPLTRFFVELRFDLLDG